jgi:hypothetical protein
MTFYEGIIALNLVVLLWTVYKVGKMDKDIEMLFQGLAAVMEDD